MFRYIGPIILIIAGVGLFAVFTNPILGDISNLKTQIASYNQALDNATTLGAERDKLTEKDNSIDPDNLAKLQKLLPDNVDNIRLILEIEKLASPYGMILEDVKYNATSGQGSASPATVTSPAVAAPSTDESNQAYGTWNLEFTTKGTYPNFISFIKDLESNLRIVDISSIDFSSDTTGTVLAKAQATDSYEYDIKIKTYWLKN
jgi:Tfp pilus assembly protein PilO